jgi:ABC-type enterochelin transport system permease subunit
MMKQLINPEKKSALIIFLLMLIAMFCGCTSHSAVDVRAAETRRITDIITSERLSHFLKIILGGLSASTGYC